MLSFYIILTGGRERIMSLESVKAHLGKYGRDKDILEFDTTSATVDQAAEAIGVIPAKIAKTLSFRGEGEKALLVVAAGDARIDNKKFRHTFGIKARMLSAEEVLDHTGHVVGGVCPFGLTKEMNIFLDTSLQRFEMVYPACGSKNSAIELTCEELYQYAGAKQWVDVTKGWNGEAREQTAATTEN